MGDVWQSVSMWGREPNFIDRTKIDGKDDLDSKVSSSTKITYSLIK